MLRPFARPAALGLAAVVLAACGSLVGVTPSPSVPPNGPDGPEEGLTTALQRYGQSVPDVFGGLYLDAGMPVLLFTDDAARHRAALEAQGIDTSQVRFVRVLHSERELMALQERISSDMQAGLEGFEFLSSALDTIGNRVTVDVKSNLPGARQVLLDRWGVAPDLVAVSVFPLITDWTQPEGGDGWRLLAQGQVREGYVVKLAADDAAYASLWSELGFVGERPSVDFTGEVVALFSQGIGSSCPELRLDAVHFDLEERLVFGAYSDPRAPRACTADLVGGAAFLVALDRVALPESPFTLQLAEEVPAGVVETGRIQVELQ